MFTYRYGGLFLLLLLIAVPAWAQKLEAPDGWRKEIIALPPEFAPDMSWTGREVLQFAPGMFKAEEADFFSYMFLLELDDEPDWEEQLLLYYGGLAKSVLEKPDLDISGFEVSIEGSEEASQGTIDWIEPFVTKKPQRLYLECRKVGEQKWIVCASPKNFGWPIWTEMRQIRNDYEGY